MNYTQGQPVTVSRPGRTPFTGTVEHIHTAPGFVAVRHDDKSVQVQCYPARFVTPAEAELSTEGQSGKGRMSWTTETLRSGIAFDVASDDHGTMGVPGTWHRVRQGSDVLLTTRNRGDALRLFQRRVRLVSGA
ncbi:hypothetical protein [Streptomyces sp. NPDC058280]|uniref:hypothetical protein n=1 Tax=Streptomyces sp. NPDC058280 TaxID=3346419 RepID=UPI0036EEC8FD